MSKNYDNWERLVEAVLLRDHLRQIALSPSINSLSSASSSFNLGSDEYMISSDVDHIPLPPNYAVEKGGDPLDPGKWEIDPAELDFSNSTIIGKGSFGEIRSASWWGTPVAVKLILHSFSDDRLVMEDFIQEVNLLMKLRHPNILQYLGAVTKRKPLLLITEYLEGGNLHEHLKKMGALSPSTAVNFALDIARVMAYLHGEPGVVIHGDLQPRKLYLVNKNAEHLKIGYPVPSHLARNQGYRDTYKSTGENVSHYRYMAPEVFKHRKYDKRVDVFSFAMILYEMLEGEPPLAAYEPYDAARCMAEGNRPRFRAKGFNPELGELMEQCWAADMNQRPSFVYILKGLKKVKTMLKPGHSWKIISS